MARRLSRQCAVALTSAATLGLILSGCGDSGGGGGGDSDTDAVGTSDTDDDSGGGTVGGDGTDGDDAGPGDDIAMGGDDTAMGGDDTAMGGDDTAMGGDDTAMGGDDTAMGGDDTAMGGDDTAMGGDDTAMGGDDTAMGGDDVSIPPYEGPVAQCVSASDLSAFIAAGDTLGADSTACLTQCAESEDVAGCGAVCMQDALGVSSSCADCFGHTAVCLADNCLAECADPDDCSACFGVWCAEAFDACSGIEDGMPSDLCLEAADFTTILEDGADVFDASSLCVFGCPEDGEEPQLVCATACIAEETGLSEGCSVCPALLMGCVFEQCSAECVDGGGGDDCDGCLVEACGPTLTQCMGFDVFAEGPGEDLCLGVADTNVIEDNPEFDAIVEQCVSDCAGEEDIAACVSACTSTNTGLTSGCASCYGEISQCLFDSCQAECFGPDASSVACGSCTDTYCGVAFAVCAGLFSDGGACSSPADLQAIEDNDVDSQFETCAVLCENADELQSCLTTCFVDGVGISEGCATCHSQLLECSFVECPDSCLGQDEEACGVCLEAACLPDFLACTGFGDPTGGNEDLCLGEGDLSELQSGVLEGSETCIVACTPGEASFPGCVEACLQDGGLSDGCAGCFGDVFACSAEACFQECFGPGANEDDCTQCQGVVCEESFTTCSGLEGLGGPDGNQCNEPGDAGALQDGSGDAAIEACSIACAGDNDIALCMGECMASDGTLSEGCAGCYIDAIVCQGVNCGQTCVDSPGAVCDACVQEQCAPAFAACSGLELPGSNAADQCLGSSDVTILQDGEGVNQTAVQCTLDCVGSPTFFLECAATCIGDETGLSAGCSGCYAEFYACFVDDCSEDCAGDTPDECNQCLFTTCSPDLLECTGDVPVLGDGACTNTDDAAILQSGAADSAVPQCSNECVFDAQPEQCAKDCIIEATGLSIDCSGCFSDLFVCSAENCFGSCSDGEANPACDACIAENCEPALAECTGFAGSQDP